MSSNPSHRHPKSSAMPELWGGIECTVNRVRDDYYDQLQRSGHCSRIEDLDLFAELGIRALRYPILWEHHSGETIDWSWADARMNRLKELGIEPIIGLVHHGSGPAHTSLLDPDFASGLAQHARAVAQRYPWIRYFNPVNEPLTTARFSCLYGHWYPHLRDASAFARALLNECQAVKKSMRAIREIIPHAQLVQTEDIGKTYSTGLLSYQAEFENERRWLTFDLLMGRFDSTHALWNYLRTSGISEKDLMQFLEEPSPPDILGINYYVVGERFLDERLERYPARSHGGNGRHAYADVSAVRVSTAGIAGPYGILHDAWNRYRSAIAITEAHLGCTRDEQLRWLMDVWHAGQVLRREGADIRAITVWSLLGAYDWHCLLTRSENYYEPGAFDLRGPAPRLTGVGKCARALGSGRSFSHPVLDNAGWWQRATRYSHPPTQPSLEPAPPIMPRELFERPRPADAVPLLITGATGTLGQAFRRICEIRGLSYRLVSRPEMDIANPESIQRMLREVRPWAVINTAGYVRVDQAEAEPSTCFRENTQGAICLAEACRANAIPLITFSSDLVFDGKQTRYVESDAVAPLNIYGFSKAQAEAAVLRIHPGSLVIRTCCFFGPWDEYNLIRVMLRHLRDGKTFAAIADGTLSPTYLPDLVNAALDLLIDGEAGFWHLANAGSTTWSDFLISAAKRAGVDHHLIEARRLADFNFPATRPRCSVLESERGQLLPAWEKSLEQYFTDRSEFEKELAVRAADDSESLEPGAVRIATA